MKCKKKRYNDELDAKIALALASKKHDRKNSTKVERKWYKCPACKGFHLTSQK